MWPLLHELGLPAGPAPASDLPARRALVHNDSNLRHLAHRRTLLLETIRGWCHHIGMIARYDLGDGRADRHLPPTDALGRFELAQIHYPAVERAGPAPIMRCHLIDNGGSGNMHRLHRLHVTFVESIGERADSSVYARVGRGESGDRYTCGEDARSDQDGNLFHSNPL